MRHIVGSFHQSTLAPPLCWSRFICLPPPRVPALLRFSLSLDLFVCGADGYGACSYPI